MGTSIDWPRKWRLGVPYQGSKNQIAREIISILPRGKRFVDLFAGGCAMTHAAMISGKYDTFLVNDLHGFGVRLFMDAIAGKCNGRWKEWVSRDKFYANRNSDPLISLCWSFGSNGRDYLYSREIEDHKRKLHEQYIKGDITKRDLMDDTNGHGFGCIERLQSLENLQTLARLESMERIRSLEHMQSFPCPQVCQYDYREFDCDYSDGDIVYCDPPYANTQRYNAGKFDSAAFWKWVDAKDYPVFVSEYNAPSGFTPIWTKGKCQLMNSNGCSGRVAERVYVADRYADRFQTDLFLGSKEEPIEELIYQLGKNAR